MACGTDEGNVRTHAKGVTPGQAGKRKTTAPNIADDLPRSGSRL